MSDSYTDILEKLERTKGKVDQFSDLLDSLESTEDKKKLLWKEIYENAITDRENASMLFTDIYTQMQSGISDHMQVGGTLAKYLERMNKSNEQLLKLAELLAKAEEKASKIDPEDLFSRIEGGD